MCGISGILNLDGKPVEPSLLAHMTRMLAHRGPDDEGLYVDGALGLGHRRLSILDLSEAGHQPMLMPERALAVSYNGEVYNFLEIRRELEKAGHAFRSHTDTEVILHAYAEWGIRAIERFNGMFAIALWDGQERTLYLIRDRLGVKPIYYHATSRVVVFASEVKALLFHPDVPGTPDPTSIAELQRFRYVLEPDTVFAGIRKVQAGHYLRIDSQVRDVQWWDVDFHPHPERTGARAAEAMDELLHSAVELRRIADVPVGAFLSGGIDSSTVVAYLTGAGQTTQTFTVGFGADPRLDESAKARLVAEALGTRHHEMQIRPPDLGTLRRIIWHLEEPILDPAVVPTYAVSGLAAEHVKVVLTGEGSDEVNGGYDRYRRLLLYQRLGRFLPAWAAARSSPLHAVLPGRLRRWWGTLAAIRLGRMGVLGLPGLPEATGIQGGVDYNRIHQKVGALLPTALAGPALLNQVFYLDLKSWLVSDLLLKVDKMSMAHSLEARTPFLDYRFVEFCAGIPPEAKVDRTGTKLLLRRVAANRLPRETVQHRQHAFRVPLDRWLLDSLASDLRDVLADPIGRDVLGPEPDVARTPVRDLFARVMLKLWHRAFFTETAGAPPSFGRPIVLQLQGTPPLEAAPALAWPIPIANPH